MYELFILSKLIHRPMHGYLIQAILNAAVGPFRRVSWGTLYPLMKRLVKEGFIVAVDVGEDDPRGKTRYRTTPSGRARFLELITMGGEYDANSPDLFSLKVGCFGNLDGPLRLLVLKDHRNYLGRILEHCKLMEIRLSGETDLPPEEQRFAMLALEHKKMTTESEILWIDSLLEDPGRVTPAHRAAGPRKKSTVTSRQKS